MKKRGQIEKRAIELEMLGWWIIAVLVLVVVILGIIFIFKPKGISLAQYVKSMLRFKG